MYRELCELNHKVKHSGQIQPVQEVMANLLRAVNLLAVSSLAYSSGVFAQNQPVYSAPLIMVGQAKPTAKCELPAIPQSAKMVVVGAYEGDAASNVVIGNQDVETGIIDVYVEPGKQPLYILLMSYESIVWRFTGERNRIIRVVVSSSKGSTIRGDRKKFQGAGPAIHVGILPQSDFKRGPSFSGVIGLPKSKIFISNSTCLGYFSKVASPQYSVVSEAINSITGRLPDGAAGAYSISSITLPSGSVFRADRRNALMPRGFDASMWEEAIRFWPGGLVKIDPKQVVAAAPVERYKVLPNQIGLSQLMGAGAIVRIGPNAFRVVRPIAHMPPSMGGAHSVLLSFAPGVPIPPGNLGHNCIVDESTGVKKGALCRW